MKREIFSKSCGARTLSMHRKAPNRSGRQGYFFLKRAFDIGVSLFLGTILLLPMVLIAVLIRCDSPGPVIYRQERLGEGGVPFTLYKFRSMVADAENSGPQWAVEQDPRCTRLGRAMRKYRIDELPQLWNVLAGQMSLIGPRPERPCFYEEFERTIPGFSARLQVKPGLTGLAQVSGGYDLGPEEKLSFDLEYIEGMSIKMDLICLWKTAAVLCSGEGAR